MITLPPLPKRIANLKKDERGYPVPFFVAYINGKPDFKVIDPNKVKACVLDQLCWICGQKLGKFKCFVVGPLCVLRGISGEPPSHLDCATFALQACPFIVNPAMKFGEKVRDGSSKIETMANHHPLVYALWITLSYSISYSTQQIVMLTPLEIQWWKCGKRATKAEILEAIDLAYDKSKEADNKPISLDCVFQLKQKVNLDFKNYD